MVNEKRLIDANALLEKLKRTPRYFNIKFDIEEAPTVDAVEVVRCKDCKHYSHCESCYVWHTDPNPEDFCGRGEKKDPGEIDFDYEAED
jgi:hypothetical protein